MRAFIKYVTTTDGVVICLHKLEAKLAPVRLGLRVRLRAPQPESLRAPDQFKGAMASLFTITTGEERQLGIVPPVALASPVDVDPSAWSGDLPLRGLTATEP